MSIVSYFRNLYGRFERPISSLSLIGGFVFDALTLKRVDTLWENIWILAHLVIVGIFIILIHRKEGVEGDERDPSKAHFWYVNILQFFFGGILSTYIVFYFRSADILVTWPFIVLLAIAFIANESLKRHYVRLSFQISLFFLSIYSFSIFLIPVAIHQIGDGVFVLSGVISVVLIYLFMKVLFYFSSENFIYSKRMITFIITGILVLVNFLYFTNLIPPIPLSLKDAGVYHAIQKNGKGNYIVTADDNSWTEYFKLYPNFNYVAGTPVYAFSAIFSPKNLNIKIVHEWQHYNEISKTWTTESTINLSVIGGRDEGFRTYSVRSNLAYGKWRVNIKTEHNQTIGHLRFNLVQVDTASSTKTLIK